MIIEGDSLLIPLPILAWGDNSEGGRPSYTVEEINNGAIGATSASDGEGYKSSPDYPGQVIFNTISNSTIGDEKNFVGAREYTGVNADTNTFWHGNEITVEDGKTYIIRLYVHNNNPNSMDAVATDVKVAFSIPRTSSNKIEVNGFITSSNAVPSEYWDYVNFNSDRPFRLEYIKGSALLENNGIGSGGIQLSDDIIGTESGGILIGYDALDGRVPGCYQYDNFVTIKVKVVYESINRPTYSYQRVNEGAIDHITFNSIKVADTDTAWIKANGLEPPLLDNETDFVGACEDADGNGGAGNIWEGGEIVVEDGKTYIVRLYVHNNGNATAEDTKVRLYVPYSSAKEIMVNGWLASSNAAPKEYLDTVIFKSKDGIPFSLYYIPGSALLENAGCASGKGIGLPDSITNQGNLTNDKQDEWTLIGSDNLDGKIPGGYEHVNYVSIKVKAIYDYEFTVENEVRLAGIEDKTWHKAVEAKVGDKVEFLIGYYNTGNVSQMDVAVRDRLPQNLKYIEGSTILRNSNHKDGVTMNSDAVTDNGIRIGSYGASANAYVVFTAEVVDNTLVYGANTLVNYAQVGVGLSTLENHASVSVYKNTKIEIGIKIFVALAVVCSVLATWMQFRHSGLKDVPHNLWGYIYTDDC